MYFNLSYVFTSDDCLGFDSFSRQLSFLYGVRDAHAILLRISSQLNMLIVVFSSLRPYSTWRLIDNGLCRLSCSLGSLSLFPLRPYSTWRLIDNGLCRLSFSLGSSSRSLNCIRNDYFTRDFFTIRLYDVVAFAFRVLFTFLLRYSDVVLTALDRFVDVVETFVNIAIRLLSCLRSRACPLKVSSSSYALPDWYVPRSVIRHSENLPPVWSRVWPSCPFLIAPVVVRLQSTFSVDLL